MKLRKIKRLAIARVATCRPYFQRYGRGLRRFVGGREIGVVERFSFYETARLT